MSAGRAVTATFNYVLPAWIEGTVNWLMMRSFHRGVLPW
jgi:hypothetical protein